MKTRVSRTCRNRVIELLVDDGTQGDARKVLAAMTLFEGTGAWMLTDLRLRSYRVPSAYSGSLRADDVHAHLKPGDEAEAAAIRAQLREFWEDDDGIHWSTYNGLVRGTPRLNCGWDARNSHIGYFTQQEGLAYLKEAQAWWDRHEGSVEQGVLPNPHRQPSESQVRLKLWYPTQLFTRPLQQPAP